MPKDKIVVALDVGSSKFTAVVATVEKGKISIIGAHSIKSKGIRDGVVNNMDKAVEGISEVLNKVEMMSGHPVSKVIVTISGTHIESLNSHGVVAVSGEDHEISMDDISRVNEAARAVSLPSTREIILVIPREYIVDKQRGIADPTGMSGFRLEVEANIIHGGTTIIKNLTKCIQQVGVEVDKIIYSGFAASEAVLTETEKELGCILLDIGGGTIDMMVYTKGSPSYAAALPIGGQNITNEIAISLRTLLDNAERIKLRLGQEEDLTLKNIVIEKSGKEGKVAKNDLYVGDLNIGVDSVSKARLNELISHRLVECFKFVQIYIKKAGYDKKLPAGIVLTGGTAKVKGIEKIAESVFRSPVRVGTPHSIFGLVDQIQGPEYSAVIGGVMYYSRSLIEESRFIDTKHDNIKGVKEKIISLFRSFLP
jgi:cell division protein FtsA